MLLRRVVVRTSLLRTQRRRFQVSATSIKQIVGFPVRFIAKKMGSWFSAPADPKAIAAATELFEKEINEHKVVLFSKSWCPYCNRAKALFQDIGVQPNIVELDLLDNGDVIQQALAEKYGQRTVPFVFIGQKLVGGCDATIAARRSGELKQLLQAAGVSNVKL